MQVSRILFKNTLLARTCLKQVKLAQRSALCSLNMQMRYMSTKSRSETAEKSGRFDEKPQKKEEPKEETQDEEVPTESAEDEAHKAELKKLQDQIKSLEKSLKKKEAKIDEADKKLTKLFNKYKYQLAENDNTVKRYKDQVSKTKDFAISKFAKDLLDVRDDLQRAITYSGKFDTEVEDIEQWKEQFNNLFDGVKMTSTVFDKTMKRFGVEEYDPVGEKFNPNIHEAVAMVDDPTSDPNTI